MHSIHWLVICFHRTFLCKCDNFPVYSACDLSSGHLLRTACVMRMCEYISLFRFLCLGHTFSLSHIHKYKCTHIHTHTHHTRTALVAWISRICTRFQIHLKKPTNSVWDRLCWSRLTHIEHSFLNLIFEVSTHLDANLPLRTYPRDALTGMSHGTHSNESWHTCEWVMSCSLFWTYPHHWVYFEMSYVCLYLYIYIFWDVLHSTTSSHDERTKRTQANTNTYRHTQTHIDTHKHI